MYILLENKQYYIYISPKYKSSFMQMFFFFSLLQRRGSKIPDDDEMETKYFVIKPTNQVVPEGLSDTKAILGSHVRQYISNI